MVIDDSNECLTNRITHKHIELFRIFVPFLFRLLFHHGENFLRHGDADVGADENFLQLLKEFGIHGRARRNQPGYFGYERFARLRKPFFQSAQF